MVQSNYSCQLSAIFNLQFSLIIIVLLTLGKSDTAASRTITFKRVQEWAQRISQPLFNHEASVTSRERLMLSFKGTIDMERNGSKLAEDIAKILDELTEKRSQAAEKIALKAEELGSQDKKLPKSYLFDPSVELGKVSSEDEEGDSNPWSCRHLCRRRKLPADTVLYHDSNFKAKISLDITSTHVPLEVFDCEKHVLKDIYWSESLKKVFKDNFAEDASLSWQYFCSAKGFMRHFPGAVWSSMHDPRWGEEDDLYDCRLRPWYVSAGGAPKDVLILMDSTGSMFNDLYRHIAYQLVGAMLTTLTDDDRVSVLRYKKDKILPTVKCFNTSFVPANHINTAAILEKMAELGKEDLKGMIKNMPKIMENAINILNKSNEIPPFSCQQILIIIADSLNHNLTELLQKYDPEKRIRIFVFLMGEKTGLFDNSDEYAQHLTCNSDGFYARMKSSFDVTEQVMKILRTLERPLVLQRQDRLRAWSDKYAHLEDVRQAETRWDSKENQEQFYRYKALRRNKSKMLNDSHFDYEYFTNVTVKGQYYEEDESTYQHMITVSVPVFEQTFEENITIQLLDDLDIFATRQYPVARLLGVAGIDIPIQDLKLLMPYHELGAGGALMLIDHRGNLVLHEQLRHVVDGDILKPGYRTVDLFDLEIFNPDSTVPRNYSIQDIKLRKNIVIRQESGVGSTHTMRPYDGQLRVVVEKRRYYWKRSKAGYTAIVALPPYGLRRSVPPKLNDTISKEAARRAELALHGSDFVIHPDWLYCRHINRSFDSSQNEILYFFKRIADDVEFPMKNLRHRFSHIDPNILDRPYQCDEKLLSRLAWEASASSWWSQEHERPGADQCSACALGSTSAFLATEGGLTRWKYFYSASGVQDPAEAPLYVRGPSEPWYRRAAASPAALVVHAPVPFVPSRRQMNLPPPTPRVDPRWLTAARALGRVAVVGYHFHSYHLTKLLETVTALPCPESESCEPNCHGDDWRCMLVDETGWVVAATGLGDAFTTTHLTQLAPAAMTALLERGVFKMRYLFDYQAVCFQHKSSDNSNNKKDLCARSATTNLRSWLNVVECFICWVYNLSRLLTLLLTAPGVLTETQEEKNKRTNKIQKDYARDRYDLLFDKQVCVNRTRITACDRRRVVFTLESARYVEGRGAELCGWPLVAAPVPNTNLLLVAASTLCPDPAPPRPHPYHNIEVATEGSGAAAEQLACWRAQVASEARSPPATCFPHSWQQEEGWRQCGPYTPEPENSTNPEIEKLQSKYGVTCQSLLSSAADARNLVSLWCLKISKVTFLNIGLVLLIT